MTQEYIQQTRLLARNISTVFQVPFFALKGGTAINLFIQNMPRISVDIDTTFTDRTLPRENALAAIKEELRNVSARLQRNGFEVVSQAEFFYDEETKLIVKKEHSRVKIEVNHIYRGTILPVKNLELCSAAQELFKTEASIPCLDASEIYGGKIIAALSRQHPRDFFDVRGMFSSSGLTPEIVECAVCIVCGDRKPIHEILFPNNHDISRAFQHEFLGMTDDPVTLSDLLETRDRLRVEIEQKLTPAHKEFLLSFVS
ncbi:MAG: nucleotidyl transferase AbiEii/AbiGii toxin family protein, partial [Puniceicoccales bacterium]|nr:nucleotidyl transferase AbiEii/AbiGii toxin family protein [Puniceicoccales bacterium]